MKIFIYSSLALFLISVSPLIVKAEKFISVNSISMNLRKEKDGVKKYVQSRLYLHSTKELIGYHLDPWKDFDNSVDYIKIDNNPWEKLNITKDKWEEINLIAYYGHLRKESSLYYYGVAQKLILQLLEPDSLFYFVSNLNDIRYTKYDNYINQLKTLLTNHSITPKFSVDRKLQLNEMIYLEDLNGVLNNYKIYNSENVEATIINNYLRVRSTSLENGKITFIKEDDKYENQPLLYYHPDYKNIIVPGKYEPIYATLDIEKTSGKIKINNFDADTKSPKTQGESKLFGAKYELLNQNKELITMIEINGDNIGTSKILPYGTYYLREYTTSDGYQVDLNEYEIHLNQDVYTIDIYRHIIKSDITIETIGKDNQNDQSLDNIKFNIYDNFNNLITTIKTNENGIANTKLPYGTYSVYQVSQNSKFSKSSEFKINVKDGENIYKKVINYKLKEEQETKIPLPETHQTNNYLNFYLIIIIFNLSKWLIKLK